MLQRINQIMKFYDSLKFVNSNNLLIYIKLSYFLSIIIAFKAYCAN